MDIDGNHRIMDRRESEMKKYLLKMTAFILIVASTMIVNVTAPGCAADRNLIYSGTYADLIEIEDQKIPPSSGEVQEIGRASCRERV